MKLLETLNGLHVFGVGPFWNQVGTKLEPRRNQASKECRMHTNNVRSSHSVLLLLMMFKHMEPRWNQPGTK